MSKIDYGLKSSLHPSAFVKSEIFKDFKLTVEMGAKVLGADQNELSAFLDEQVRLSPELTVRLKKAFGVSIRTLYGMQLNYEIAWSCEHEGEVDVAPFEPTNAANR